MNVVVPNSLKLFLPTCVMCVAVGCAGLNRNEYNVRNVNASDDTTIDDAVEYAEGQRDKYDKAAQELGLWALSSGGIAVAGGGAIAGAGAAEVTGKAIIGASAGLASLLGLGEIIKPAQRARIFETGSHAIQCSIDVVVGTFGDTPEKEARIDTELDSSAGDLREAAEIVQKLRGDYRIDQDTFKSLNDSEFDQNTVQNLSFAMGGIEAQFGDILSNTSETIQLLQSVLVNRKEANEKSGSRLIKAVNSIKGQVNEQLSKLVPDISAIKTAAKIVISPTSPSDGEKIKKGGSDSMNTSNKLNGLSSSIQLLRLFGVDNFKKEVEIEGKKAKQNIEQHVNDALDILSKVTNNLESTIETGLNDCLALFGSGGGGEPEKPKPKPAEG